MAEDRSSWAFTAEVVRADLAALNLSNVSIIRAAAANRIALFQIVLRICEMGRMRWRGLRRPIYYICRWYFQRISEKLGFDIPLYVFDQGLSIAHRGSIVVNGGATIGKYCRIHQGVTVGAVRGKSPRIKDYVFIGPNAGIYGDVLIGEGSVIGPHALVVEDVPAGSVVYGRRSEAKVRKEGPWRLGPL